MKAALSLLRQTLVFVLSIVGGSILGAVLSFAWGLPTSLENITPLVVLGVALTYAGFGSIPALLFGLPAILLMKRKGHARWPATAVLTVGGGTIGALLMFVTFGGFKGFGSFEQLGATAGASIGFVLGLLLFSQSSAAIEA